MEALGAGLAIGLAGFGVGLGEGNLVAGAIDAILRNPDTKEKTRTNTILYLALVESAAIYGLIIAILRNWYQSSNTHQHDHQLCCCLFHTT